MQLPVILSVAQERFYELSDRKFHRFFGFEEKLSTTWFKISSLIEFPPGKSGPCCYILMTNATHDYNYCH